MTGATLTIKAECEPELKAALITEFQRMANAAVLKSRSDLRITAVLVDTDTEQSPAFTVELEAEPDDLPVPGEDFDSGDPDADKAMAETIIDDLLSGNDWAWCCVKMTVTLVDPCPTCGQPRSATDYLGKCNYASEDDFVTGPYYDDMLTECLVQLGFDDKEARDRASKDTP